MKGCWTMSGRHARSGTQKNNRRGCLITVLCFVAICGVAAALFFGTHLFDGLKNQIYSLFYPQKYTEQVESSSREFGVDEDLIYAVIRTESGFREEVESHAGAIGLMQLMPETFTWLQESLDDEVRYSADSLKDPAVNIRYGTYFLSWLLERYGDVGTALAAYNGGLSNVDDWLSDSRYSQNGKTLTDIPYSETKKYVERVQDALEMYRTIYPDD